MASSDLDGRPVVPSAAVVLALLLVVACSDLAGPNLASDPASPEDAPSDPASSDVTPSQGEFQKLLASDGGAGHWFGRSVAIAGDVMIVGARFDESAYVFERSGGAWSQVVKLTPEEGSEGHQFGYSVAVDGDVAVVGEMWDDENGSDSGSAYIFERSDGSWPRVAVLAAGDGAADDRFGFSVAVDGDVAVVGALGDESAYVFERSAGTWSQAAKLTPGDGGGSAAFFGDAVALSGDVAVVGAPNDDDSGPDSGSAYVFERSGGIWSEVAKLTAADGAPDDRFGGDVAVDGDVAIVGAWGDDDYGRDSGSAYVFERSGGAWTQAAKLTAPDGASSDRFGGDVAWDGDLLVVAAGGDGQREAVGSAYVFDGASGWSLMTKLTPTDGGPTDFFGSDVAVDGGVAIVGAMWDDDHGTASGSAYLFDVSSP